MRAELYRYKLIRRYVRENGYLGEQTLCADGEWREKETTPMLFTNMRTASEEAYRHHNPRYTFILGPKGGKYRPHKPAKEDFKKRRYQSGGKIV
jgi:hypothetical protein